MTVYSINYSLTDKAREITTQNPPPTTRKPTNANIQSLFERSSLIEHTALINALWRKGSPPPRFFALPKECAIYDLLSGQTYPHPCPNILSGEDLCALYEYSARHQATLQPLSQEARQSIYLPTCYSQMPRAIEFFASGPILVHLTRHSRCNDPLLGKGTYKTVSLAFSLFSEKTAWFASASMQDYEDLQKELIGLGHCKNVPGFIQCYNASIYTTWNKQGTKSYKYRLLLERADCSLKDLINEQRLNRKQKIQITEDLIACIANMHTKGLLHRDLKPDNILCQQITAKK